MELDKIEISLDYADTSKVELDNMSIKALESFLSVVNSLKNIAETISTDVTFTIKKGSAYTAVNGSVNDIRCIYEKIEEAIIGESEDETITSNLRNIQKEIQKDVFKYQFKYSNVNLNNKIKSAKKIVKKRSKGGYKSELAILSGNFNSIGGNDPNYHFDYGTGIKTTIECTLSEAIELKDYLYQKISCLVQKRISIDADDNIKYYHCSILKNEQIGSFKNFIKNLNKTSDIFERLDLMYDFTDNSLCRVEDLAVLLKSYKYFFNDINEYKTLLILTKNLKEDPLIKSYRVKLLNEFDSLMNMQ